MNNFEKAKLIKKGLMSSAQTTEKKKNNKKWKVKKKLKGILGTDYISDDIDNDEIFALYFEKAEDIFCVSVMSGLTDVVRNLLDEKCVDINGKYFSNGRSAIHIAAINKDLDMMIVLAENGCDIYAVDDKGKQPAEYLFNRDWNKEK